MTTVGHESASKCGRTIGGAVLRVSDVQDARIDPLQRAEGGMAARLGRPDRGELPGGKRQSGSTEQSPADVVDVFGH